MDEQLMTITVADGHTVTGSRTVADPAGNRAEDHCDRRIAEGRKGSAS